MKICPTCKRTYTDDVLSYCLDDGTPLQAAGPTPPGSFDPQATVSFQPARDTTPPSQQSMPAPTVYSTQSPVAQPQYQPQQWSPMPQQGAQPRKRSAMPWVIAGLVVFLILIVGAGGIIGLLYYIGSNAENKNGITRNSNLLSTRPNVNTNRNSNSSSDTTSDSTPPDVSDDFSTAKWAVSDDALGRFWYENDELHVHAVPGRYVVEYAPEKTGYYTKNATTKITVRCVHGDSPKYGYGFVIHGQLKDTQLEDYAFLIKSGPDPQYSIILQKGGKDDPQVKWTSNSAIRSGTLPNQLEVRVVETLMSFYINGQYVDSITDSAGFKTGRVGVYTSDTAEIAYDDLSVVH